MSRSQIIEKISNYSSIVAAIVAILLMFFKEYLKGYIIVVMIVGIIAVALFLGVELAKFISKLKGK